MKTETAVHMYHRDIQARSTYYTCPTVSLAVSPHSVLDSSHWQMRGKCWSTQCYLYYTNNNQDMTRGQRKTAVHTR